MAIDRNEMLNRLESYCTELVGCNPSVCKIYGACEGDESDESFVEMSNDKLHMLYSMLSDDDISDAVKSPSHYTVGGIEVIDYLRAKLTPEEFKGYCKGNILKYLSRAGHKDDETQEYRKALMYMTWLAGEK